MVHKLPIICRPSLILLQLIILADLFTSIFSLPPAPPRWLHCQQNTDFDTAAEAVKAKFSFIRCRHHEQVASKCVQVSEESVPQQLSMANVLAATVIASI